jgi:hypothetical protein
VQNNKLEVSNMKQNKFLLLVVFVTLATMLVVSCGSADPVLGDPTDLQKILNELPEVSLAGKQVKIQFGGEIWIARESGKNVLAGTFTSVDTEDGSDITLSQTHIYSSEQKPGIGGDIGWVKTPGPSIELEYKAGPPASLTTK